MSREGVTVSSPIYKVGRLISASWVGTLRGGTRRPHPGPGAFFWTADRLLGRSLRSFLRLEIESGPLAAGLFLFVCSSPHRHNPLERGVPGSAPTESAGPRAPLHHGDGPAALFPLRLFLL